MTAELGAASWGEITDETIAYAQELVGTELRRDRFQWVSEASYDAIRHFAEGIGDRNPLYRDRSYGERTSWGTMLAPPTFLYAVDSTAVAPRLKGVQWIYAGVAWTWYDVVRLGHGFDGHSTFHDQQVKGGDFARRWVLQTGRTVYQRRGDGLLVAEAFGSTSRTPRGAALDREGKKYEKREPQRYTGLELANIEAAVLAEAPRGAEVRYAEDVEIGEELRPIVKGPLTSTDMIAYYAGAMGARPYGGAHADVVHYRQRHEDYHISEITGGKDSAGRGHLDSKAGDDVGMGGAYDIGPQRISWGVQMLTDWMGDAGFVHKVTVRLRRPNLIGDTTWWKGRVSGKDIVDGYHLVHVQMSTENQRNECSATGTATVILPSREGGEVVLPVLRDLVPNS